MFWLNIVELTVFFSLLGKDSIEASGAKISFLIFLLTVCSFSGLFTCVLSYYHSKFVCKNLSTYLVTKMNPVVTVYGNPFDKGGWKANVKDIFTSDHLKRVDFRALIRPVFNFSLASSLFNRSSHNNEGKENAQGAKKLAMRDQVEA